MRALLLALLLADTSMVAVPAGPFLFGSDDGDADERPRRRAQTAGFTIDRTEVTRKDYERCVAAKACAPATRYSDQSDPNLPQSGVSWDDAVRYCHFAGKRLPTELEWEKAARGTDGRVFPWGDKPDCSRANYGAWADEGPCGGVHPGRPEPVGRYPGGASPYGALDMAGNVWEWVDARYPGDASRRVLKGGSCCSTFLLPRAANRVGYAPSYRDADIGFRCASNPGK